MRRRTLLALGLVPLVLAACATVEIRETRVVEGRVTDDSGRPVANSPVVVVGRSLSLVTTRLEYQQAGQQEARTVTDAEGRYRLEFIPSSLGNNFYLFFHDRTGFDSVRYRTPEPIEITDLLRRERRLAIQQVLLPSPTWPEVARQLAFYGEDSDRGRILRRHGLPEKRESSAALDTEIWRYESQGISYWFSGDRLVQTNTRPPSRP
ncbi:MAG: carboxypeptidase-like regulatory domain-containing protein [Candidatus Methylomirabilales bacterium]